MTTRVIFAFDQNAGGTTNFFTLDNAVRGVLDNTTFTLGGSFSLVDVTQYVRNVSINLGRSRVIDRTQAGSATIVLDNRARLFDPTYEPNTAIRTNLATNPSFETQVANWTGANASSVVTQSSVVAFAGSKSLRGERIGTTGNLGLNLPDLTAITTQGLTVVAGDTYTASGYMYPTTNRNLDCQIIWYNAAGAELSISTSAETSGTANTWQRISHTETAPANATAARINFRFKNATAGELGYLDAVLFEAASTAGTYFDGSSAVVSGIKSNAWNGSTGASTSTQTYYISGTGSPYWSSIVPRKNVTITHYDQPIFTGLVDDWQLDYDKSGDYTSTAICADGFLQLGQATVGTTTKTSQLSGARVSAILTEVSWPSGSRDIDTGSATLQADTPAANTNALEYLQDVSDTEFGAFYMSRSGLATFQDRSALQNFTATTLLGGTGIPITSFSVDYGAESLFNQISLTRLNGGTATATDSTSQTAYGVNRLTKTGLLFSTDAANSDMATYLLSVYKDPKFRISEVSIAMDGLTVAQRTTVATLDVTSTLTVTITPTVGSAITQYGVVDRVVHNITPGRHDVVLSLSQAQPGFILNDSVFGVLNDDPLGF